MSSASSSTLSSTTAAAPPADAVAPAAAGPDPILPIFSSPSLTYSWNFLSFCASMSLSSSSESEVTPAFFMNFSTSALDGVSFPPNTRSAYAAASSKINRVCDLPIETYKAILFKNITFKGNATPFNFNISNFIHTLNPTLFLLFQCSVCAARSCTIALHAVLSVRSCIHTDDHTAHPLQIDCLE